uniref:G5R-like protein n=1 Tax=Orf virus TaxID=10258 RepID=Q80AZ8_ORFV|nr:G5R-like protein [Orf virus]
MMTMAYSCADEDEFRAAVEERVQHWMSVSESGRIVVFLDRGEIPIKQPLRDQRRKATRDRAARHREFIAAAEADAAAEAVGAREDKQEDEHAEFAEEIRAEKQLKLQRIRFQLSIANHEVVKSLIESTLARAGDAVEIVFCDGVDAEMVMCARGRAEAERRGRWPLLVTTDQDALLFTSTDRDEKIVSTVSDALPAATGLSVVADMIACLPARRNPAPEEVERLLALEARARGARVTDAMLAQTAQLLGYGASAGADGASAFAVSGAKGLMCRLRGTAMFFNAEYVEIESEPRLLKLR